MQLNERETRDLRFLRQRLAWDDNDAKQVMQSIRESEHGARYYTVLAAAHRAGYEQTAANGFIRLQEWCIEKGLPDPFGPGFDVAELDAMAVEPRRAA